MKRQVALAAGVAAAAIASLALASGRARAFEDHDDAANAEKKVETRVVVRTGGGRLGVSIDDPAGETRGASVRSVEDESPAAKAGLKQGDLIVRFDGENVRSAAQLARLVAETPAGRSVAIEVKRGAATQTLTATLSERPTPLRYFGERHAPELPEPPGELPEPPGPPLAPHAVPPLPEPPLAFSWNGDDGFVVRSLLGGPRKLGIEYIEMGDQLASYFKLSANSGVLVTSVDAEGPAAKAGMKAGDVVTRLGSDTIADGHDLREAVSRAEGGSQLKVTVQRDGHPVELEVTLAKPEPRRRTARGVSL